jgi:hypothetical protein
MKHILLVISIIFQGFIFAQSVIDIPAETFPFYELVEWKGNGAFLVNRDQSWKSMKVFLTFVGKQSTSTFMWKESFNPVNKTSYLISGENARYIYFLDNLTMIDGKYAYSQINTAGTVKSSATDLYYAVKKLFPLTQEDLTLIDIINTDKALIHVFRYHNKKDKKYIDIAASMTHHNLTVYTGIIGETSEQAIKDKLTNGWFFVGSTNEQIYFATRDNQKKKDGFTVKEFNTRVESKISTFLPDLDGKFDMIENVGFGTDGKNYLKNENSIEKSVLTHINGKFYLSGIKNEGSSKDLQSYVFNQDKWDLIGHSSISASKQTLKFGVMALNEGLAIKLENTIQPVVKLIPFDKTMEVISTNYSPQLLFNPSRFIFDENKNDFIFKLQNRIYTFNLGQLNKAGNVKFEYQVR